MYFCSILIWNKFLITNQWSIKLSEVWHLEKNYEKCFHTWKFGPLQFLKNLKTNSKFLINCRMIYLYLLGSKLGVHFGLPKIHTPVKGLYKIGNLQLLVEKKKKRSIVYLSTQKRYIWNMQKWFNTWFSTYHFTGFVDAQILLNSSVNLIHLKYVL